MAKWLSKLALTSLGAILAAIVAAYFTYKQWSAEQNIAREKQDYERINSTSLDIGNLLSSVMTLQTNLFFTALDASDRASKNKNDPAILSDQKNAQAFLNEYQNIWNPLKEQITLTIWKAYLQIDRVAANSEQQVPEIISELNPTSNQLSSAPPTFCQATLPGDPLTAQLKLDWNNVSDNIAAIYHCLFEVHGKMAPVRDWINSATPVKFADLPKEPCGAQKAQEILIACDLDNYAPRFQGFLKSVASAFDRVRQKYGTKGLVEFMF